MSLKALVIMASMRINSTLGFRGGNIDLSVKDGGVVTKLENDLVDKYRVPKIVFSNNDVKQLQLLNGRAKRRFVKHLKQSYL